MTIVYQDEWLDVVDEQDQVIGKQLRSEAYAKDANNFRCINALVKNDIGQLWIPRRTSHKRIFPNCLDMSVAGHVESGEGYEVSLFRETQEEINIDLKHAPYKALWDLNPHEHGTYCFMRVYEIQLNDAPDYNPHDYCDAWWMTPQEILERIDQGQGTKPDLSIIINHFYN